MFLLYITFKNFSIVVLLFPPVIFNFRYYPISLAPRKIFVSLLPSSILPPKNYAKYSQNIHFFMQEFCIVCIFIHIILYIFMYIQLYINTIKKGYRKNNLYRLVFFLYPSGFYNGIKIYNIYISKANKKIKFFLLQN